MASSAEVTREEFRKWLDTKLGTVGLDSEVYGEYIYGTLVVTYEEETERENEEVMKTQLEDILDGIIESDCAIFCDDIIQKWSQIKHPSLSLNNNSKSTSLKPMILKEHVTVQKDAKKDTKRGGEKGKGQSILSEEEKKLLVTQFGSSYLSSDDETNEQNGEEKEESDLFLTSNTNKSLVTAALKEKREDERRVHLEKKEQIKINQRQQRQKQFERKEKEKQRTQKREKKR